MSLELRVVSPSPQRCESLRAVLEALEAQTLPADCFEVIVSLDGSTDGSEAMLEALHVPYALHIVRGESAGPGIARNRGAAAASGHVLLFLDDDILAEAGLVAEHLAVHQEAPGAVVCLGHLCTATPSRLSPWEQYLCQHFDEHYQKLAQPGYAPNFWDCLSGSLSLSRDLWERSGGFDPTFRMARHEDIEFGYRLEALGARFVYHPGALGYHRFAKSFQLGIDEALTEGLSAERLAARYPELRPALIEARWKRYSALIRLGIALFLRDIRRHRMLAALAARCMALILTLRLPLAWSRPIYQSAYHLYFWLGVRTEAAGTIGRRDPLPRNL
jgi:glycosyltransferase involved in cell wall biosynthesis